jgi:tetratricopeptide (TPR) repeat protein
MNRTLRVSAILALALASSTTFLRAQSDFGKELNLGTQAYKRAEYEKAMRHFEKAVALDPDNIPARMYLATAYASQYIPGVEESGNTLLAERAIEQYQYVLNAPQIGGSRLNSAKGIAYLYLNLKKFEDSKEYCLLASDLDPKDPENYYSMGVIDWTQTYQPRMEARAKLDLRPEDHLNPSIEAQRMACDDLRGHNLPTIQDGIEQLTKAIELRPDYDDAMAYINLMYRERADVECNDLKARERDLKAADDWVDKTLAVKKAKAEKADRPDRSEPTTPNPQ